MLTHVEFRSDRFPALSDEDELVNRGIWGKRLADFLRDHLAREGFATKEPIAEDWGWVIPVVNDSFALWIGCANYGDTDGFLCFIEPNKPFVRRIFRKVPTRARIAALQEAMDKVLTEEVGIHSKRWCTHMEFNNASRQHTR